MQKKVSVPILMGLVLLIAGCATVPITGRRQLSLVPHSQLVSLSAKNYKEFISKSKLSPDRRKTEMVINAGQRIAMATEDFLRENAREEGIRNYDWEFNLIEDDEQVNAFAMAGGKIAVFTGMVRVAQDEDGLATVIAHEIAHTIANHGGERTSQLLLAELGGIGLAAAIKEEPEKTKRIVLMAYGAGASLGFILPYSRLHETEADRIGLILMAKAGYDPRAAIPFWERMQAEEKRNPPEFLSTHPAPKKRIESIRQQIPQALTYYKK